ncbi:phosphoglycolate phosphatase [Halorhodospira abdelmalekii]|uniref:HAD-IA family hydrolase n=1 Tax=Halorhodospira abdelmalekii TaxID=421629 RepID=UPI001903BF97|nr:HAD-IA family hydrolase [Halorhodospira abdelmalekii]MBK1734527.1 phosphoglycolate phosphatase [Halorhodospira abdelmalekii]
MSEAGHRRPPNRPGRRGEPAGTGFGGHAGSSAADAAVIFDLDGTLVDTAPDLIACLSELLADEGRCTPPYAALRSTVSHGARVMVQQAFSLERDDRRSARLEEELVRRYRARIAERSRLFPGMEAVLATLEANAIPWGVVTNKPSALTTPLLEQLALDQRAAVIVSGDTLARAKPDPLPIRHAAATMGCPPQACLAVGDARRDIEAAVGAGAFALAALFGYLHAGDHPWRWGAHGLIASPLDTLDWLERLTLPLRG